MGTESNVRALLNLLPTTPVDIFTENGTQPLAFEMLGFLGPDVTEGVSAVREKRRPDFD